MPSQCPTRTCHHLHHMFVFRKPLVMIFISSQPVMLPWVGNIFSLIPMICKRMVPLLFTTIWDSLKMAVAAQQPETLGFSLEIYWFKLRGAQANLPVKPVAPRTTTSKVMANALRSKAGHGFKDLEPKKIAISCLYREFHRWTARCIKQLCALKFPLGLGFVVFFFSWGRVCKKKGPTSAFCEIFCDLLGQEKLMSCVIPKVIIRFVFLGMGWIFRRAD